jgi:hypothetical protein
MTEAIARIIFVAISYGFACISGLIFLIFAVPETGFFNISPFSAAVEIFIHAANITDLILNIPIVTFAALGLAVVVFSEIIRTPRWIAHVLSWGAAGTASAGISQWLWHAGSTNSFNHAILMTFAASGFISGFIYWLIAGRTV